MDAWEGNGFFEVVLDALVIVIGRFRILSIPFSLSLFLIPFSLLLSLTPLNLLLNRTLI